ncbi:hypothetical protein AB0M92_39160 [Streptomyces sp. NPDC051582]|uniref:hypothetical protein n=1 Tax=Streptomyces sp. NPDC051582 TaxID=3155167 RepID=UPI003448F907
MEFMAGIHGMRAADAGSLLGAWADSGVRVFEVETGGATEKAEIIQAFARVVPTEPLASGRSWEGFSDSLWEGLYQLEDTRVAIALSGDQWTHRPHGDVQTALDVLQDVVTLLQDEQATVGRPTDVCVLLVGNAYYGWGDFRIVWVLEAFDRRSGDFRERYLLPGVSDSVVSTWIGIPELTGDLYDVPEGILQTISTRSGIPVFPEDCDYFLGRETLPEGEQP